MTVRVEATAAMNRSAGLSLALFFCLFWMPVWGDDSFPVNRLVMHDVPRPGPDLVFVDENGNTQSLADFRGKVLLVNVWATWCQPCVREMPALAGLQAALDPSRFRVLPISIDRLGAEAASRFYKEHGIHGLPVLAGKGIAVFKAIDERRLPVSLLIDVAGREVGRYVGAAEWNGPEYLAAIRRVMGPS